MKLDAPGQLVWEWGEVRCRRCHRKLSTEQSRLAGFGKTCAEKAASEGLTGSRPTAEPTNGDVAKD